MEINKYKKMAYEKLAELEFKREEKASEYGFYVKYDPDFNPYIMLFEYKLIDDVKTPTRIMEFRTWKMLCGVLDLEINNVMEEL